MTIENEIKYALSKSKLGTMVTTVSEIHAWVNINARVTFMIAIREALQNSVDLLGFFRQFHFHQQFSYGHVDWIPKESKFPHIAPEYSEGELVVSLRHYASNYTTVHVLFQSF